MAEELGDKTELPTARKRTEARERGQIAKSVDLGAAIDAAGSAALLGLLGSTLVGGLAAVLRYLLDDRLSGRALSVDVVGELMRWTLVQTGVIVGPFIGIMLVIIAAGQVLQVGWSPTATPLEPKLDRLNPIAGAQRVFSGRGLVKSGLTVLKLLVVLTVTVTIAMQEWQKIAQLPQLELSSLLVAMLDILWRVLIWVVALLLILGIADYTYQLWQQTQDLKMTKQEVKDEQRSTEGDLETKGRRLRIARQMAMQRLSKSVPKADVIVTNPTHFAVALKYESGSMSAPTVVAKGADFLALRIRELAAANAIPIVERPPLARALYHNVPVGRQIKPEFYEAVAEILAYVYRLKNRAA